MRTLSRDRNAGGADVISDWRMTALRFFARPGMLTLLILWLAATVVLLYADRTQGLIGIGLFSFVAVAVFLGHWILPRGSDEPPDVFLQTGKAQSLILRGVIIAATYGGALLLPLGIAGVPPWNHLLAFLFSLQTGLPRGGLAPYVTLTFVLVPATLLLTFGARLSNFGISHSRKSTWKYVIGWIAVPAVLFALRIGDGQISLVGAALVLAENLLLNGLPEEFLFRGAIFSFARNLVAADWAFFAQAVFFSLFHFGVTVRQEHGNITLILANVLSQNIPVATLFGIMAVRSRSLALPIALHTFFDALRTSMQ